MAALDPPGTDSETEALHCELQMPKVTPMSQTGRFFIRLKVLAEVRALSHVHLYTV